MYSPDCREIQRFVYRQPAIFLRSVPSGNMTALGKKTFKSQKELHNITTLPIYPNSCVARHGKSEKSNSKKVLITYTMCH